MKKYILNTLLLGGSVLLFTACNDNSWNNNLDGFEENTPITDVQSLEYTLTASDYANLAANTTNIEIAKNAGLSNDLKAVGTQHYFTENISARDYVPAFLSDPDFQYFTLSDGSSLKLTYNVATNLPEEITAIGAASQFEITEPMYQQIWGSEEDYANSFAPSQPASKHIPAILNSEYPDAEKGEYIIVNYNTSAVDPVFGGGTTPDKPAFEMSDVIGSVVEGSTYDINGVITGICERGYIITDKTGSILVYCDPKAMEFNYSSVNIGDQVVLNGEISSYNKGLQVVGSTSTFEVVGNQKYTYPAPTVYDGAALDALLSRSSAELAIYAQITATVSISGNYINFIVDGAEKAQGSGYYVTPEIKSQLVDGQKMTITGYYTAISSGKFCNFIITELSSAASAPKRVASIPSTNENAVYYFDGNKWSLAQNTVILNPADYTAMGQTYGNLSGNGPAQYLPIYLKQKYPYANIEDAKFVVYKYYAGGATTYKCDQYTFNGSEWVINNGVVTETAQFVRNKGAWMYDPNVTITLPVGKGIEISTLYYQACTDWVFENIDKPLGSTGIKSGMFYVTSYGNNEYYSGCSAYQGNVDLRASAARTQYPAAYEGMTDEEVVETMKSRFCNEVMPGALGMLHPDAAPIEGLDVIYTINFGVYTGSTSNYTARFKVIGQGQFEFVDCTWYE